MTIIPFDPPLFYVVQALPPGGDAWRVYGVFSSVGDADALVTSLNARVEFMDSALHDRISYDTLADMIFRDRVGKLAPLIAEVEKAGLPKAQEVLAN